jgi:methylenetetrahydrofolate reductase (NADPH)
MTSTPTSPAAARCAILTDFSLEMTGKDVDHLRQASATIPPRTRINVTFLENEDLGMRLAAARSVRGHGFVPVPHISARRIGSPQLFEQLVSALHAEGACTHVFAVAGDPPRPQGPYQDSLALIESGVLQRYDVRTISIAGYPQGHPAIADGALWTALEKKAEVLAAGGLAGDIITQFGFDVDAVLAWIEQVRLRGITMPVRVGVPGPAGVRRLVRYAARFGVGTSAGIARKYGFSLTNLLGTAGPDRFLVDLAARYRPEVHGEIKLHFYTFGGLGATAEWIAAFEEAHR